MWCLETIIAINNEVARTGCVHTAMRNCGITYGTHVMHPGARAVNVPNAPRLEVVESPAPVTEPAEPTVVVR